MILDISDINKRLSKLKGWTFKNGLISKEYSFDKYMDGIQFVNAVATKAEELNHHPDIILGYCKVTVSLTSHDEGGVTEKCILLAKNLERIV
jgi:4a-hydroxytetrahydrobiopterin dehydratase